MLTTMFAACVTALGQPDGGPVTLATSLQPLIDHFNAGKGTARFVAIVSSTCPACVFGAEAAARRYFEITAAEMDQEQAALLATVLPNPKKLRAWNPGPYAQQRRQEVLDLLEVHANAYFLSGL